MVRKRAGRIDNLTTENIVEVGLSARGFIDRCPRIFLKVRLNSVLSGAG
jgi:hypothetical protein